MGIVRLDSHRCLQLSEDVAKSIDGKDLRLSSWSADHLFFRSKGGEGASLVGSLDGLAIEDILSFVSMFRKSGALHIDLGGGRRTLYFEQGDVVYAVSSFPGEDACSMLVARGEVEAASCRRLVREIPDQPEHEREMVRREFADKQQVWIACRSKTENIFYNLFRDQAAGGSFYLESNAVNPGPTLSLSTQNLLMEGLRRTDEKKLFLTVLNSTEHHAVLTGLELAGIESIASDKDIAAVYNTLQRENHPADVIRLQRLVGLSEYETMRALYRLVGAKVVKMEQGAGVEAPAVIKRIFTVFDRAFSLLYNRAMSSDANFFNEVNVFIGNLPEPYSVALQAVEVRDDGTLDADRAFANLAGLEIGDQMCLVGDTLNELLYFGCVRVREIFGVHESHDLVVRVQDIGKRLAALAGGEKTPAGGEM